MPGENEDGTTGQPPEDAFEPPIGRRRPGSRQPWPGVDGPPPETPKEFEPPSGYKRRQMFPRDDPPARPPDQPAEGEPPMAAPHEPAQDVIYEPATPGGGIPSFVLPTVGVVVVVGGLVAGGILLFGGDDEPAGPAAAQTVTSAAAEVAGAAVAGDEVAEGGALDTLSAGTLETLPPGTLETLPPGTLGTLPRTTVTTIPPTTAAAQGESGADSCAQAAEELAGVIRALFATVEGKTLQEAGEALAAVNGFDAQVTPTLERGRELGCTEADIVLVCNGLTDIVPNGEASELVYEALTAQCG